MIVWGGYYGTTMTITGGRYDPASDTWQETSLTNVPEARQQHSAVWTGSQMIVWGGCNNNVSLCGGGTILNSGGRYDPATDTWQATSTSGAPEGSYSAAVVLDSLWRVCATFQARLEPHHFATVLKKLGRWYNNAEITVERNFTGYSVLEQLIDYPNVTHQRDYTTGKITSQRGWWTNDQTRDLMMTIKPGM
jgi:N-acetylneuraminic acid mutarotase